MALKEYAHHEQSERRGTGERSNVLYVEDEDLNWDVATLHLEDRYHLTRARNSREVFAALQRQKFRAILMDIQLAKSDLDGIQITQVLRGKANENVPDYAKSFAPIRTPIIFLTAYSARYRREELIMAGGDDMMVKPVNFVALSTALIRIVLNQPVVL